MDKSDYDKVLQVLVDECIPTNEEKEFIANIANKIYQNIAEVSKNDKEVVSITFVGSFAKGTWLKGEADIDIFIKFKDDVPIPLFEELGTRIGFDSLREYDPYKRYSNHPFVEAVVEGIKINIVPCYDVELGKWKSAADRSPFHTDYINQMLSDPLKDEVRFLKKFLKIIGAYGAELSVSGFSGYVSEVLIVKYGSFINVLKKLADFIPNEIISVEPYEDRKFNSPIVILDPIDKNRNLGAAISNVTLSNCILGCRKFLSQPSSFFDDSLILSKELLKNLVVIEFDHNKTSSDILWGQLKKSLKGIVILINNNGFSVIKSTCIINSSYKNKTVCAFLILLQKASAMDYYINNGPNITRKNEAAKFIISNKNKASLFWVDDEMNINCILKNNHDSIINYLNQAIERSIDNIGIPTNVLNMLKSNSKIYFAIDSTDEYITNRIFNFLSINQKIF